MSTSSSTGEARIGALNATDFPYGRGAPRHHPGKTIVHRLIEGRSERYLSAPKGSRQRQEIGREILNLMQGGTFKRRDENGWYTVSEQMARSKISDLFSDQRPERKSAARRASAAARRNEEDGVTLQIDTPRTNDDETVATSKCCNTSRLNSHLCPSSSYEVDDTCLLQFLKDNTVIMPTQQQDGPYPKENTSASYGGDAGTNPFDNSDDTFPKQQRSTDSCIGLRSSAAPDVSQSKLSHLDFPPTFDWLFDPTLSSTQLDTAISEGSTSPPTVCCTSMNDGASSVSCWLHDSDEEDDSPNFLLELPLIEEPTMPSLPHFHTILPADDITTVRPSLDSQEQKDSDTLLHVDFPFGAGSPRIHEGKTYIHSLVDKRQERYRAAPSGLIGGNTVRSSLITEILTLMVDRGGRFKRRHPTTRMWYAVSEAEARSKISNLFYEKRRNRSARSNDAQQAIEIISKCSNNNMTGLVPSVTQATGKLAADIESGETKAANFFDSIPTMDWTIGDPETSSDDVEASLTTVHSSISLPSSIYESSMLEGRLNLEPITGINVVDEILYLLSVMWQHKHNPVFQIKACDTLKRVAMSNDDNQNCIARLGGIQAVVTTMQCHQSDATVQHHALSTLERLALYNNDNQKAIARAGGINVLIETMKYHILCSTLQAEGCHVLWRCSDDRNDIRQIICSAGGIDAARAAMTEHKDNDAVQKAGRILLIHVDCNAAGPHHLRGTHPARRV